MQLLPAATTDPTQTNTPTTSGTNNSSTNSSSTSSANSTDSLGNETTFLKLLMAQVQNQDPTNPADPAQFVGELVSFSQLEQLLGINQGVQSLVTSTTPTTPTNNSSSPASGT